MELHEVRVQHPGDALPPQRQLAWKLAAAAEPPIDIPDDTAEAVVDRLIDNAAVALAAFGRDSVRHARDQAAAHPRPGGAPVLGLPAGLRVHAEWAAWANGTAVRELDFHDTFLAAEYAHPADTIPPVLAVAQQCGASGRDLLAGIATAYEVHVALAKGISLHEHRIDHVAHLGPAVVAGIGAVLGLPTPVVYQGVQQAVHVSCQTRQTRKGAISSWKAYAPGHVGKQAVEAIDRAMRGEHAPSPVYEGEDGIIAVLLGGPDAVYTVALPGAGEPRRAILETYPKEYAAEYHAQVLIDLAFRLRQRIRDIREVERVVLRTSRHTHRVIGTGAGDPEKLDPAASRETLDHSAMYIFAVALEDGRWHHHDSYTAERAHAPETLRLWRAVETVEDPVWTDRYHADDPAERAFGAHAEVRLRDGEVLVEELAVPDAHPAGERPFRRADYLAKFERLTGEVVDEHDRRRFLDLVQRLPELTAEEVTGLHLTVSPGRRGASSRRRGIF